jgi:hypothetical protein
MRAATFALTALFLCACSDDKKAPAGGPGPTPPPSVGSPSAAPAQRPLTSADVENYVAVTTEMKKAPGDADALARIATARGLPMPEWMLIHARIASALLGMRAGVKAGDGAPNQADIDFVTVHRARLEPTLDR